MKRVTKHTAPAALALAAEGAEVTEVVEPADVAEVVEAADVAEVVEAADVTEVAIVRCVSMTASGSGVRKECVGLDARAREEAIVRWPFPPRVPLRAA
jgi:hypothetical protein